MKTILSVVGARPQFVKAAPLSRRLRRDFREVLLHTGQHYDPELSASFFLELGIPEPDVNLSVGSADHAEQTSRMAAGIEAAIAEAKPDLVLTYGDTNSTLAGSVASAAAGVPLAHVEAGLRSFNPEMPEEVNRIAADHLADLCLCPTETAVKNLVNEGAGDRARLVGDVMLDACLGARDRAGADVLHRLGVSAGAYCFATVHRPENTGRRSRLLGILEGFARLSVPVVFAVHPGTKAVLEYEEITDLENVIRTGPVSYLETVALVTNAKKVLTDSGGLQKEAAFLGTPCVTLRDETEWTETVEAGWNRLAGADPDAIEAAVETWSPKEIAPDLEQYGGGRACDRIAEEIHTLLGVTPTE